jgi:predicted phage terminase large subunit-like protein
MQTELNLNGISPEDFQKLCQNHLLDFAELIYPGYQTPRHLREIAKILEAVERGDKKRILLSVPVRHGKSVLTSQIFPSWYLGKHPDRFIILASHGQDLAEEFGMEVINFLKDEHYQAIFPNVRLSSESHSKTKLRLNSPHRGKAFFTGVGGSLTGRGAHVLLIDDPIKDAEQADSDQYKKKLRTWYKQVARTRLMPGGAIIVISTRWRCDDLIGWLTDHEENVTAGQWEVINFPAIAEDDTNDWRKSGEVLWPEMWTKEYLEGERLEQGTRNFLAIYQGRPVAEEGNIIHADWIVKLPMLQEVKLKGAKVAFLDTAFKTDTTNDYSAVAIGGRTDTHFIIEYTEHKRLEFPQLLEWVRELIKMHQLNAVCVEDKASGQSLVQMLRKELPVPIIPMKAEIDKVSRVNSVAPLFEAKKILFREPINPATWEELVNFPAGKHDDLVDAVCGLVAVLSNRWMMRHKHGHVQPPSIYKR